MRLSSLLVSGFIVTAVCTTAAQTLMDREIPYRLEYNDVVTLTYRYTPEFSQDVTIGPDGRAQVAGLGSVYGLGLTLDSFKERLVELSSVRLVAPDVTLTLKSYVKPHIMVEGEVNTPGRVDFRNDISVLDAIAMAGGFRESGAKNHILLFRSDASGIGETRLINVGTLIKRHKLEEIPKLRPGDTLYISASKWSAIERVAHLGAFGAVFPVK